ncbi:MAG: 50S ribosomal protein L11 [Candidatus Bathyarchaeia archaeon]
MTEKKVIEVMVEGGKATAGPPIGPALGPLGVNVLSVVNKINELTKPYSGMKVPVKIHINVDTKEFEVEVGIPTTSALIIKELGVEKGSGDQKKTKAGNLSLEQVVKIAKIKSEKSYAKTIKGVVKEVLGSCLSMGVLVENRDPREIQREIDEGKWDHLFKQSL